MRLRGDRSGNQREPDIRTLHAVGFCAMSLHRLLDRTGFRAIRLEPHRANRDGSWADLLGGADVRTAGRRL
jgi:hypothetical protein